MVLFQGLFVFLILVGYQKASRNKREGLDAENKLTDSKMEDTLFIFPYTPTLAQSVLPVVPISLGPGISHAVREAQYWHHGTLPNAMSAQPSLTVPIPFPCWPNSQCSHRQSRDYRVQIDFVFS